MAYRADRDLESNSFLDKRLPTMPLPSATSLLERFNRFETSATSESELNTNSNIDSTSWQSKDNDKLNIRNSYENLKVNFVNPGKIGKMQCPTDALKSAPLNYDDISANDKKFENISSDQNTTIRLAYKHNRRKSINIDRNEDCESPAPVISKLKPNDASVNKPITLLSESVLGNRRMSTFIPPSLPSEILQKLAMPPNKIPSLLDLPIPSIPSTAISSPTNTITSNTNIDQMYRHIDFSQDDSTTTNFKISKVSKKTTETADEQQEQMEEPSDVSKIALKADTQIHEEELISEDTSSELSGSTKTKKTNSDKEEKLKDNEEDANNDDMVDVVFMENDKEHDNYDDEESEISFQTTLLTRSRARASSIDISPSQSDASSSNDSNKKLSSVQHNQQLRKRKTKKIKKVHVIENDSEDGVKMIENTEMVKDSVTEGMVTDDSDNCFVTSTTANIGWNNVINEDNPPASLSSSYSLDVPAKEEHKNGEITEKWLEGFLKNVFNPMNTTIILGMLEKVLDDTKFQQIKKKIIEDQKQDTITDGKVENDDDEDVLTATRRRMITIMNEKKVNEENKVDEISNSKIISTEVTFVKPNTRTQIKMKEQATSKSRPPIRSGKVEKPKLQVRRTRSKLLVATTTDTDDAASSDGDNNDDITTEDDANEEKIDAVIEKKKTETKKYRPSSKTKKKSPKSSVIKYDSNNTFDESNDQRECSVVMDESFESSFRESDYNICQSSDNSFMNDNSKKKSERTKIPGFKKETEISPTTIKNVDIEMHSMGPNQNICCLCQFKSKHMAKHYASAHPTSEIMISRLTGDTIQRLKETQSTVQHFKNNKKVYHLKCPFCNITLSRPSQKWMLHFATHTGEYMVKCSNCYYYNNYHSEMDHHMREICPKAEVLRISSPLPEGVSVMGYICNICNYIQMKRDNVLKHLRTQHDFDENLDEKITEITLLNCKKKTVSVELEHIDHDNIDNNTANTNKKKLASDNSFMNADSKKKSNQTKSPRLQKETEISSTIVKNIDIEMHSMGPNQNFCCLCKCKSKYMTKHYASAHPTSEIMISRLTGDTIQRLKETQSTVQHFKNNKKVYHLKCPFCDITLSRPSRKWMLHFATHTGEYMVKCSNCYHYNNYLSEMDHHMREICPKAEVLRISSPLPEGVSVMGYICNICNYIQMKRDNVLKHLRTQHDFDENLDEKITEITLLNCKKKTVSVELEHIDHDNIDNNTANTNKKKLASDNSFMNADSKKKSNLTKSPRLQKETEISSTIVKNIDMEMHSMGPNQNFCCLCKCKSKYMTKHYASVHPTSEIMISRLTGDTIQRLKETQSTVQHFKYNKNVYHLKCPFCNIALSRPSRKWMLHFATHTGEYLFKCSNCYHYHNNRSKMGDHMREICPKAKVLSLWSLLPEGVSVMGYICNICNYIQMKRDNVVKHLRTQHDLDENLAEKITEITLLSCKKKTVSVELERIDHDAVDNNIVNTNKQKLASDELGNKKVLQSEPQTTEKILEVLMPIMPNEPEKNYAQFASNSIINTENINVIDNTIDDDYDDDDWEDNEIFPTPPSYPVENFDPTKPSTSTHSLSNKKSRHKLNSSKKDMKSWNDTRSSSSSSNDTEKDKVTKLPTKEPVNQPPTSDTFEQIAEVTPMDMGNLVDQYDLILDRLTAENAQLFDEPDMDPMPMSTKQLSAIKLDPLDTAISAESLQLSDHVDVDTASSAVLLDNIIINNDIITATDGNDLKTTTNQNPNGSLTQINNDSSSSNTFQNLNLDDNNLPENKELKSATTTTADTSPPIVNRIDKLGYSQRNDVFKYYCLIEGWTFLYSVDLRSHFNQEHEKIGWEGYCHTCVSQVSWNENLTLDNELQHMMDCHVTSKVIRFPDTQVGDKTETTIKPMIKFRRLSGDMLSSICKNPAEVKAAAVTTPAREEPKILNKIQMPDANIPNANSSILLDTTTAINTSTPATGDNQSIGSAYLIRNIAVGITLNDGPKILLLKQSKPTSQLPSPQQQPLQPSVHPPPIIISKVEGGISQPKKSDLKISKVVGGAITCSSATLSPAFVPTQQAQTIPDSINGSELKILNVASIADSRNNTKFNLNLKPWTTKSRSKKSSATSLKLLRDICLFSLYKCMGEECTFTTNNANIMTDHLNNHLAQVVTLYGPFYGYSSFLECAYCTTSNTTIDQLVNHITNVHSQDIYQCPYCFYRACSDYYIITHLEQFHPTDEELVFVCFGEKTQPNLIDISNLRRQFVKPIGCSVCDNKFYNIRNLENHIRTAHQNGLLSFKCSICGLMIFKNSVGKHFSIVHNIDVLQCLYCIFGGSTLLDMRTHMANEHSSCFPYVALRQPERENLLNGNESLDKGAQLACIADVVDPKLYRTCPYLPSQLDLMSPKLNDTTHTNSDLLNSIKNSDVQVQSPIVVQKSSVLEITHVQSQSNEVFAKSTSSLTGSSKNCLQQQQQQQPTKNKLPELDVHSVLETASISGNLYIGENRSSVVGGKLTTTPTQPTTTTSTITQPNLVNALPVKQIYFEVEEAANTIVSGTGLSGRDLYRCGFPNCSYQSFDKYEFDMHILAHALDTTTDSYPCYHCKKYFKSLSSLKNHTKVHSIDRYFCFWCVLNGSTLNAITRHISSVHFKSGVKAIPLIPGKIDRHIHYFVVGPKTLEPDDLTIFNDRFIKLAEHKMSLAKTHYKPEEINILPIQRMFQVELHCSICEYRTKVRKQLYVHLQFHLNQGYVPSINSINPVQCLNTNEKHCEETVNPACSAYIGKDFKIQDAKLPEYIPELRRFVCGVPNCSYLTINEAMIKSHLNASHSNDTIFRCSHCSFNIHRNKIWADKVVQHLKYHNKELYQCGLCNYVHYQRYLIVKHIVQTHTKQPKTLIRYEREEGNTKKETIVMNENCLDNDRKINSSDNNRDSLSSRQAASKKRIKRKLIWECSICRHRTYTNSQILDHMQQIHLSKDQYQCDNCNFTSTDISCITTHANAKHPTQVTNARFLYYKILVDEVEDEPSSSPSLLNDNSGEPLKDNDLSNLDYTDPSLNEQQQSSSSVQDNDKGITAESVLCHNSTFLAPTQTELEKHLHLKHGQLISVQPLIVDQNILNLTDQPNASGTNVRLSNDQLKPKLEDFDKYIKYICYYCPQAYFNDIKSVSNHYVSEHKPDRKRFLFTINHIYKCHLCPYSDIYKKIVEHYDIKHYGHPVVTRDAFTLYKCGLCSYHFSGNPTKHIEHYLENHPETQKQLQQTQSQSNINKDNNSVQDFIEEPKNYMTDNFLTNLLQHTYGFDREVFCDICLNIFDNMEEFIEHHKSKHGSETQCWSKPCIRYSCPICPSMRELYTNTVNILKHVRYDHSVHYGCNVCDRIFEKESELYSKTHLSAHPMVEAKIYFVEKENTTLLDNIELIFPNGFTMKKSDAKFTKYYNWDTKFIMKSDCDKRQQIAELLKQTTNEERTRTDSDTSSVASSSVLTTTSNSGKASHSNKKRNNSAAVLSSSSLLSGNKLSSERKLQEDWDDEPLSKKFKIDLPKHDIKKYSPATTIIASQPYSSSYGMKRDNIDLAKIYTKINVSGNDINISCDRFIKLFKLNIFVKCERICIDKYLNKNKKKNKPLR